jgi:hypothetical protein
VFDRDWKASRSVSVVFCCCDKYLRKSPKRRKYLPWFTVSVYGWLAPLLWAWGEAEHHDREHMVEHSSSSHGVQEAERVAGRGQDKLRPSKICLRWFPFSNQASHSTFHHLPTMPSYHKSINRIYPLIVSEPSKTQKSSNNCIHQQGTSLQHICEAFHIQIIKWERYIVEKRSLWVCSDWRLLS